MAAVLKAIDDGADWVEIDVQESADGEVIVAHDSDFMKSAGVELKVWNATMSDIARIDVGSSFDPAYAAERTPTLRDVLVAARGKSRVMIELKYYGHNVDLEDRVARIVEETEMTDKIAVISLKLPMVEKMRGLRPGWRTGILAARAVGDLSKLDTNFIAVNTGQVSVGLIRRCKAERKAALCLDGRRACDNVADDFDGGGRAYHQPARVSEAGDGAAKCPVRA